MRGTVLAGLLSCLPSLALNCLSVTGDLEDLQLEVYVRDACD